MRRRTFLGAAAVLAAAPRARAHEGWHTWEVTTTLTIAGAAGPTQAWVPLPLAERTPYQRSLGDTQRGNASSVEEWTDDVYGARLLHARWSAADPAPELTVVSTVATRDHAMPFEGEPLTAPRDAEPHWRRATSLLPLDGVVRERALAVTAGRRTDVEKARAIYDWIVENTFRDPQVRGCGRGDVRGMLESGDLGGKCADLNALFVGLARAAGVPARDVYGLRVGPSRQYQSLGRAGDVTKSQHCRAEFHASGYGWIPVDPADVRKLVLEEPPAPRPLDDPLVRRARADLFGGWEMNWIAWNRGRDLALPGSTRGPLPFLMYPQAETAGERRDSLAPETFAYRITAREVPS